MLTKAVMDNGKDEKLPEQVELHAGPLTLLYEQGDIRYIRLGNSEILRRIYVAIRDRNWGTVPPVFSNVKMDIANDSFQITFDVANQQNEIDFAWRGTIQGKVDGTVSFSMDGEARSTFWRNRIGFCILHPAFLAGSNCQVEHVDGRREQAVFPLDFVSSQPVVPFSEMKKVSHQVAPGAWADVEFSGELFETEDQRNWTDASYKTFCTPLRLPYPVEIQAGTRINQSVTLRLRQEQPASSQLTAAIVSGQPSSPIIEVDRKAREIPLPDRGLGVASHGQPLGPLEINRLKSLHLHHLRVDLVLSDPAYAESLQLAIQQAAALYLKLEIALLVSDQMEQELAALRKKLDSLQPRVSAWLCYPEKELFLGGSPTAAVVNAARKYLAGYDPAIPFCAGTNTDLIFMKRSLPPLDRIQKICFAITPQVHAFDNASLIETLPVQGAAVDSARLAGQGLPVMVSPITLKPRFNSYATTAAPALHFGELPPQVDVRQMSLFGAAWTTGSFKAIAEAATDSVTYFETSGWRGVMETGLGSPLPDIFHSIPGGVYPLYHVLADIGEFTGGSLLPVQTSHPLQVNGLLLRTGGRERMLLANYSGQPQHVHIANLLFSLSTRWLDETNLIQAMQTPEVYRQATEAFLESRDGALELDLLPFAVVKIDGR